MKVCVNLPEEQFVPLPEQGRNHGLAAAVGYTSQLQFDASKPDGTPRKLMNVERMNAMGWVAKTEMREGLAVAYRDFLEKSREEETPHWRASL